jgi:hypothetical protein
MEALAFGAPVDLRNSTHELRPFSSSWLTPDRGIVPFTAKIPDAFRDLTGSPLGLAQEFAGFVMRRYDIFSHHILDPDRWAVFLPSAAIASVASVYVGSLYWAASVDVHPDKYRSD